MIAVRVIGVDREALEARNTAPVEEFLAEADSDPESARTLQNHIAFVFPDNEEEEMMWINPQICAWGRQLHERVPHLLYYQFADPSGMTLGLVKSAYCRLDQLPETDDEVRLAAAANELLLPIYAERLVAAAVYAEEMADDWRVIVGRFIEQMDDELGRAVSNTVDASLALGGA